MGANLIYITDLIAEVLNRFKGQVFRHKIFDVFLDVGTPNRYEKANNLRKEAPSMRQP